MNTDLLQHRLLHLEATYIAGLGHVIFVCGLLNFFWFRSSELDYLVTFLSALVIFFAVLQVKPPISTLDDSTLDKIRLGTAFESSTYFLELNILFSLLLSPTNLQSVFDYLGRLIAALILLLGVAGLQRALSQRLGYRPLESRIDSHEYSLYEAYYFSSTTFSIVLAVGSDLLIGTLSYVVSLLLLTMKSRRIKWKRLFSALDAASDRFVLLFRKNVMKHAGAEAFLGLTGWYLVPLTILTNFKPTMGSLLLTAILTVPPILSAATALRFSLKPLLYVVIPVVVAVSVWLLLVYPDAYPPAQTFAVLIRNSPIPYSSQEISVVFVMGIYSMSTAIYVPLSKFLQALRSNRFDDGSIERAGNEVILGAVIPVLLIVVAYVLLFSPDFLQLAWIVFSTLIIVFFLVIVFGAVLHTAAMDIRDRLVLIAPKAHFVVPPRGGFYAMVEHIWKNELYSLIIFPHCLAIVAIGKQNLLEWFRPSVMKKRDAVEEARLSVIRKRTTRQREEDLPISLYELACTNKSNQLIPAKEILEVKVGESKLTGFLAPRTGTVVIRTQQSLASFNISLGQEIANVRELLSQMAPGRIT